MEYIFHEYIFIVTGKEHFVWSMIWSPKQDKVGVHGQFGTSSQPAILAQGKVGDIRIGTQYKK